MSHSVRIALLFGLLLVALAAILVIKSGRAESHINTEPRLLRPIILLRLACPTLNI